MASQSSTNTSLPAAGCLLLALLALRPPQAAAQPAPFHPIIVDLGAICGGGSFATAVNENGVVAGSCDVPAPLSGSIQHAGLWYQNRWTDLGTLGGPDSTATAINEQDQVVGTSSNGEMKQTHAFLWDDGVMTDLGDLGFPSRYENSIAYGINDLGQVVGSSGPPGLASSAFVWVDGVMVPLPSLGGPNTNLGCTANAINSSGLAAGYCTTPSNIMHAVLWDLWDNTSLYLPAIAS